MPFDATLNASRMLRNSRNPVAERIKRNISQMGDRRRTAIPGASTRQRTEAIVAGATRLWRVGPRLPDINARTSFRDAPTP